MFRRKVILRGLKDGKVGTAARIFLKTGEVTKPLLVMVDGDGGSGGVGKLWNYTKETSTTINDGIRNIPGYPLTILRPTHNAVGQQFLNSNIFAKAKEITYNGKTYYLNMWNVSYISSSDSDYCFIPEIGCWYNQHYGNFYHGGVLTNKGWLIYGNNDGASMANKAFAFDRSPYGAPNVKNGVQWRWSLTESSDGLNGYTNTGSTVAMNGWNVTNSGGVDNIRHGGWGSQVAFSTHNSQSIRWYFGDTKISNEFINYRIATTHMGSTDTTAQRAFFTAAMNKNYNAMGITPIFCTAGGPRLVKLYYTDRPPVPGTHNLITTDTSMGNTGGGSLVFNGTTGLNNTSQAYLRYYKAKPMMYNTKYYSGRLAQCQFEYAISQSNAYVSSYGQPWMIIGSHYGGPGYSLNLSNKQLQVYSGSRNGNYHEYGANCVFIRTSKGWVPYFLGLAMNGLYTITANRGKPHDWIVQMPMDLEVPTVTSRSSDLCTMRYQYTGTFGIQAEHQQVVHPFTHSLFGILDMRHDNPDKSFESDGRSYRSGNWTGLGVTTKSYPNPEPTNTSFQLAVNAAYITSIPSYAQDSINKYGYGNSGFNNAANVAYTHPSVDGGQYLNAIDIIYTRDARYASYPNYMFTGNIRTFSPEVLPIDPYSWTPIYDSAVINVGNIAAYAN